MNRVALTPHYIDTPAGGLAEAELEAVRKHEVILMGHIERALGLVSDILEGADYVPHRASLGTADLASRIRDILDPERPAHECYDCEGKPACTCADPDVESGADWDLRPDAA